MSNYQINIKGLLLATKETYKNRRTKELAEALVGAGILLALSVRSINYDSSNIVLLSFAFFLYLSSTFFVILKTINTKNSEIEMSQAFLYSVLEKMFFAILFVMFWLTGLSPFFNISQGFFAIKTLRIIMILACTIALLVFPLVLQSKLSRIRDKTQGKFINVISGISSFIGTTVYLYFVFLANIWLFSLDFFVSLLSNFLAWFLMPTLIWNISELLILCLVKWPKKLNNI